MSLREESMPCGKARNNAGSDEYLMDFDDDISSGECNMP